MPPRRRTTPEEAQRAQGVEILGGVARQIAHPVATAYRAFRDEGLTEDEAMRLAEIFMRQLLGEIGTASE